VTTPADRGAPDAPNAASASVTKRAGTGCGISSPVPPPGKGPVRRPRSPAGDGLQVIQERLPHGAEAGAFGQVAAEAVGWIGLVAQRAQRSAPGFDDDRVAGLDREPLAGHPD